MTSTVTRKFSELVIEDLNVAGLMRGNTPRAQADAGMGDIKRQLIYKGRWRHTEGDPGAPMWFPSSKTCSACGTVNPNLKRERMWTCPDCGTRHDRNLNAAINLRNLIMPAGRSRDGPGQEVMSTGVPASRQGANLAGYRSATKRTRPGCRRERHTVVSATCRELRYHR